MKVCVLQSSYQNSESLFCDIDPPADIRPYAPNDWIIDQVFVRKSTATRDIYKLARQGYDVFINLCDGSYDEDRAGIEVVRALENMEVPFTGANLNFYEPSKETMKMICLSYGITTSPFVFVYNDVDIEYACSTLKFPVIVKHYNGYSSIGMTNNSRCSTLSELYKEARKFIKDYGGALVEEFIEGREFTVLCVEDSKDIDNPISLHPIECIFPEGETFKHFGLKWKDYEGIRWVKVEDENLSHRLKEITKKMFIGCRGRSYGRVDIRQSSSDGKLYMLEINPNCGIFYPSEDLWGSADYILGNCEINHLQFLENIVECAFIHYKKSIKPYKIDYRKGVGFGMYARRNIKNGEIITKHEEQKHTIVTKSKALSTWSNLKKTWFYENAYPISEDIYVMWSEEPTEWKHINHSCDPNAWLLDMDMVARKDIKIGAAITMDYATFYIETMKSFICSCKTPMCRQIITGNDYKMIELLHKYEGHVSAYIKSYHLLSNPKL